MNISIWDGIFRQLWGSWDYSAMKLAASLLSDKDQVRWWWVNAYKGTIGLECFRGDDNRIGPINMNWSEVGEYVNIWGPGDCNFRDSESKLIKAYENWKNNNLE